VKCVCGVTPFFRRKGGLTKGSQVKCGKLKGVPLFPLLEEISKLAAEAPKVETLDVKAIKPLLPYRTRPP